MYKITIPASLVSILEFGEGATLSELRRAGAERLFVAFPHMLGDDCERQERLRAFSEKILFFEENGIETFAWIPLLGFSGDSEEGCEGFTRVHKLHDGKPYKGVFCPMDEGFAKAAENLIVALSQTGVKGIILDDEFCLSGRGDGGIGCCCEKHMEEYCARIGESITREELRDRAFCGGRNKYRDAWMELQGDTMLQFARCLRKAADSVNPDIRFGFCAGRTHWDVEGVSAIQLARALAGKTKPIMRLAGAPYWVKGSLAWPGGLQGIIEAARLQAHWCAGTDVEFFAEGDTNPRPRFAVPAAFLEGFDMALRADGSTDGCLKYMLDYTASPTYETGYIDRHLRNQPLYDGIEDMFSEKKAVGVNIFENMFLLRDRTFPEKPEEFPANTFPADNDKYRVMPAASQVFACENSLPVLYGDLSVPTIVFGENAYHVPLDAPYLILDGRAACILKDRGIDVGADSLLPESGVYYEVDEKDGERERTVISQLVYRAELKDGAESQSRYEGEKGGMPAMYRYENDAGQRFLVYTFDAYSCRTLDRGCGGMFSGYSRQKRLFSGIEWLCGKRVVASCTGNPWLYMLCKEKENKVAVGLWNFFEDAVFAPTVKLNKAYTHIRFLNCSGTLSGDTVQLSDTLIPYSFAAFEVW
ncbi:MAG: hypothetical protein E7390_06250 [Ruminococcaceae bacterium]|nr:hypothetical protein [Oscillospiraceae bacterium]